MLNFKYIAEQQKKIAQAIFEQPKMSLEDMLNQTRKSMGLPQKTSEPDYAAIIRSDPALKKEANALRWGDKTIHDMHRETGKPYNDLISEKLAEDPEGFKKQAPALFNKIQDMETPEEPPKQPPTEQPETLSEEEMRNTDIKNAVTEAERADTKIEDLTKQLQEVIAKSHAHEERIRQLEAELIIREINSEVNHRGRKLATKKATREELDAEFKTLASRLRAKYKRG